MLRGPARTVPNEDPAGSDRHADQLLSFDRRVSIDGSEKHLIRLGDGGVVEAVYLPTAGRSTLCVSSQVGCTLNCTFCATGRLGFRRNLSADEILAQAMSVLGSISREPVGRASVELRQPPARLTNVVFMGMGEPFYNYANVLTAADRFADPRGLAVAPRRITISTAGVLPQIEQYIREDRPYKLAISITSAIGTKRDALMPINKRYPLGLLRALLERSPARAVRRVMLEVPLLAGVNDGPEDAEALLGFCRGLPVRANLIPWNPAAVGPRYARPDRETVLRFQAILRREGMPVFVRKSLGTDIEGACGQLAGAASGA